MKTKVCIIFDKDFLVDDLTYYKKVCKGLYLVKFNFMPYNSSKYYTYVSKFKKSYHPFIRNNYYLITNYGKVMYSFNVYNKDSKKMIKKFKKNHKKFLKSSEYKNEMLKYLMLFCKLKTQIGEYDDE